MARYRTAFALIVATALCLWVAAAVEAEHNIWTSQGPLGGVVKAIAVDGGADPEDPLDDTIYAAVDGLGVYKSVDGGSTWENYNDPLPGGGTLTDLRVQDLALVLDGDPILYAATNGGGVFKLVEDGTPEWEEINTDLGNLSVLCLAVDPSDSDILYAGTSGGGVYRSDDGGASWAHKSLGLGPRVVFDLEIVVPRDDEGLPFDPPYETIVAATDLYGVYASVTSADLWFPMNNELAFDVAFTVAIDQADPASADPEGTCPPSYLHLGSVTVYVGTSGGGVFRGLDPCDAVVLEDWEPVNENLDPEDMTILSLAVAPEDEYTVSMIYAGTEGGRVYRMVPSVAASWVETSDGLDGLFVDALVADTGWPRHVFAGTANAGLFRTLDSGANWYQTAPLAPTASGAFARDLVVDTRSVSTDPYNESTLYVGTFGGGVFRHFEGGRTPEGWEEINDGLPPAGDGGVYVLSLAGDGNSEDILYAGTNLYGLYMTEDATADPPAWTNIGDDGNGGGDLPAGAAIHGIAVDDSTDPSTVWVATGSVYRDADAGATFDWTEEAAGLPANATVVSLTIDPTDPAVLYATTREYGAFKWGGSSWQAINLGLTEAYVRTLAVDPDDSTVLYAGTDGGGVFKSIDGGLIWTPINSGLGNLVVLSLAIDQDAPEILYAGTDGGGVFKSLDAGASWAAFNLGLTNLVVEDLEVNPDAPRIVYAATDGGGVFDINQSELVGRDPTGGLVTDEKGAQDFFDVWLIRPPIAEVTLGLESSDTTEGTVSPETLTFTPANWFEPQEVTVTGVADDEDDGDVDYTIAFLPLTSADPIFDGFDPADVSATNLDVPPAAIIVDPTSGLVTDESGATDTFTVVLNRVPDADVIIEVSSSDTTEGTVSPLQLTFTDADWDTPQEVTVTGVNDAIVDGDIAYTVVLAAAASDDPAFDGLDPDDVSVTNEDDDVPVPGITVDPVAGLITHEGGGTDSFTVVLDTEPTDPVSIAIGSSDTTEGTVSTASLLFTPANWSVPQTVTVTGVYDAELDGDVAYTVVVGPVTSDDGVYAAFDPPDVSVTNLDVLVVAEPIEGLFTDEWGLADTFTVRLTTVPTDNVLIELESSDPTEGTVSPEILLFTPTNWATPQTVTVTGVDDAELDGDVPYLVVIKPATSLDEAFLGQDAHDVSVTNLDLPPGAIIVDPISGLETSEDGTSDTFTVVLNRQPAASVSIAVSSSDPGEGTASPASLTFTTGTWATPQVVTVTGVADGVIDANVVYKIILAPAVSADEDFNGVDPTDVFVTNLNIDPVAGTPGITVDPVSGLVTDEDGGTDSFTVVLTAVPGANVTIPIASSDATEGTVSTPSLTFTAGNWSVPQTVTVTGVGDALLDGDVAYAIQVGPTTSADGAYNNLDPPDVSVTNLDLTVAVAVNVGDGVITDERGMSDTFTVALTEAPADNVFIDLASSDTSEATVNPPNLVFTPLTWGTPQVVTVTGVADDLIDGDVAYSIVLGPLASDDPLFDGDGPVEVPALNRDVPPGGIIVDPLSGLVTTEAGGFDEFTVVLNRQPTASVTIDLSSSDPGEGTVEPTQLVFLTGTWAIPQTVTVTGVADDITDADVLYKIVLAPAVSADPDFSGVDPVDVFVTNMNVDVVNVLENPGFETGDLTSWTADGWAVTTLDSNTGDYCAEVYDNTWIRQDFATPIPVEEIAEISFWLRQIDTTARFFSFDLIYGPGDFDQVWRYATMEWTEYDVTSELRETGSLAAIRIWGVEESEETVATRIDDLAVKVFAELRIFVGDFESGSAGAWSGGSP